MGSRQGGVELGGAEAFASSRGWERDTPGIVSVVRAVVAGIGTDQIEPGAEPAVLDFLAAMRPHSLLLRMSTARVPAHRRMYVGQEAARGFRIDEGKGTPMTVGAYDTVVGLPIYRHGAMSVAPMEVVEAVEASSDVAVADGLASATAIAEDASFLDPTFASSATATGFERISTGGSLAQIDADLGAVQDHLSDSGSRADQWVWGMTQATATYLARVRGSGGAPAYPTVGAKGGSLFGIPVLTTGGADLGGSPTDRLIVLIDQSGVRYVDEGVELGAAAHATIQMDDAPTQSSVAAVTATSVVSMWQTNSVAFMATRWSSWYVRPGACAYISGVTF
jgi:hypothetical protein